MMLLIQFQNSLCTIASVRNGYYQWKCVPGKCLECKLIKPMSSECASSELKIKRLTKKLLMGKKWKKVQKTIKRVYHDLSFKDVYLKLASMKKLYIT